MSILPKWLMSGPRKQPCTTIVVHATAGSSLSGALSALRQRELSYHYIIEKDGTVTKCVPISRVAWHAGKSLGPQGSNVNQYSIGISLVNRNDGRDAYPKAQCDALFVLCDALMDSEKSLRYVTTHAVISPGRKTDPRAYPMSTLWKWLLVNHPATILWVGHK